MSKEFEAWLAWLDSYIDSMDADKLRKKLDKMIRVSNSSDDLAILSYAQGIKTGAKASRSYHLELIKEYRYQADKMLEALDKISIGMEYSATRELARDALSTYEAFLKEQDK